MDDNLAYSSLATIHIPRQPVLIMHVLSPKTSSYSLQIGRFWITNLILDYELNQRRLKKTGLH